MEKSKKGLADTQEGEFILNESGTSVSVDPFEEINSSDPLESTTNNEEESEQRSSDKEDEDKVNSA